MTIQFRSHVAMSAGNAMSMVGRSAGVGKSADSKGEVLA
jgi:hypothetical protein